MTEHEQRLIDEYSTSGSYASLLARLQREHRKMLLEMCRPYRDYSYRGPRFVSQEDIAGSDRISLSVMPKA